MKKSLIALALLGAFSGAVVAQSNVTLYGILDVNIQSINPNGPQASTTGINSGYQSGNRWGMRGSEALGGGTSAVFTVESGFDLDTGLSAQSSRLFGRQAWVGLSGNWGTLVGGRLATLSSGTGSFDMIGGTDPFGASFTDLAQASTMSSAASLRMDNTVAYLTPMFGGFKAGAMYSFNLSGQETPGSGTNTKVLDVGANWSGGPFYFAITYDVFSPPDATGADKQKNLQLGGSWDLKFVKLFASYAKEEDITVFGTAGSAGGVDADVWNVGVNVPIFGGTLMAGYSNRDADGNCPALPAAQPAGCGDGPDLNTYGIAYTYPLSRRTNLYGTWAVRDGGGTNENNATWDRKVYTLGIRHLF